MTYSIGRFSAAVTAMSIAFLLTLLVLPAQARQDVVREQFSVDRGGTLVLDVDFGAVEVLTQRGTEVQITLERDVDGASDRELKEFLSRLEYRFDRRGDDVIVELRFDEDEMDRSWRRWKRDRNLEVNLTIVIPKEYNVDFRTGAGNVDIADLTGNIEGRTGAGNIHLGRTAGLVDVSSGAGDVVVEGARGEIRVQSGAGNVTLEDVDGMIEARTGAGNIEAWITRELNGRSSFDTGAGNVTVYLDGDIGADVDAKASLGNAKSDFDLRVRGKFMSKSFSGRVNGGGPSISMSAGVGNVSLRRN